ncbi:MAG: hypothetical protein AABX02_02550 [archaeon]
MEEKPSVLFLVILGVAGSILFSRFAIEGTPAIVFVIPLAIIAAMLHDTEAGITTGMGIAFLNGIFIESLRDWNIIAYALAAGITVFVLSAAYPKTKTTTAAMLMALVGSLVFILFSDFLQGDNMLFRESLFLGTFALAAHVIAANVIIVLIAHTLWIKETK